MNREKLYWILQIAGWSTFFSLTIFTIFLIGDVTTVQFSAYFFLTLVYFLCTHAFRHLIKEYGWFNLPIPKLILYSLTALIFLSIITYGAEFLIRLSFGIADYEQELKPLRIVGSSFIHFLFYTVWGMIYFLYHFLDNYNSTLKYKAKINEIKLNHLRSQLNPHFIFNALNSVRALVDENPIKAKSAITQISNILRYSLILDNKILIPFEDEFNIVKDYLNLEKIRFEERLNFTFHIDSGANKFKIPPMMLQTIVENALKHGISNLVKGGIVDISCIVDQELKNLHILVKNSGQLKLKPNASKKKSEGHGINNTVQRLKLIYGNKASFKIYNSGSEYVITEIKIPKQTLTLE